MSNQTKEAARLSAKKHYNKFKNEYKERAFKQRLAAYGLTPEDYEKMHSRQGGLCAICHRQESIKNKRLAVDHCHETLKVRGLLCQACNTGLGKFREGVKTMLNAISYIKKHRENK